MTRDEAIKLVRDKKCPTSRLEAEDWINLLAQLIRPEALAFDAQAPAATDAGYCPLCDHEYEMHSDAVGPYHIVKGERVPCCA